MRLQSKIRGALAAAITVYEAKKRKPPTRPGVTFFSELDTWLFVPRADTKVCPLCLLYAQWSDIMGGIRGDQLRTEFPYLKIQDENTITGSDPEGRGLVHRHCRCILVRKIG